MQELFRFYAIRAADPLPDDEHVNLDTGSNGSVHSMPSIDSVAEVKVLMTAYGAENGRNPASISVITRGGSKQFHGSAAFHGTGARLGCDPGGGSANTSDFAA